MRQRDVGRHDRDLGAAAGGVLISFIIAPQISALQTAVQKKLGTVSQ